MSDERHLLLLIEYRQGQPIREPVHVDEIAPGRFRLRYSPGLVQGIAAGDEFRLTGDDGAFEVLRRGGNLAVQLFAPGPVEPYRVELVERVSRLGGSLDGAIERGFVFSVPLSAGFPAVEQVFDGWVSEHEGWEWYFGNVYDPSDGVTPLDWWVSRATSRRGGTRPRRGLLGIIRAVLGGRDR